MGPWDDPEGVRFPLIVALCAVPLMLMGAVGCSGNDAASADAATDAAAADTSGPTEVMYACDGTAEVCNCVGGSNGYNRCTTYPVTDQWCCGEKAAANGLAASCICYSPTFFNDVFVPQGLDPLDPCNDWATRSARNRVPTCPP
jgi:hypothetical protein